MENQYLINLWAAILALEYGIPSKKEVLEISDKDTIVNHCMEVIERHVGFQMTLAQEEYGRAWIEKMKQELWKN